jgi:hypothetical protein
MYSESLLCFYACNFCTYEKNILLSLVILVVLNACGTAAFTGWSRL